MSYYYNKGFADFVDKIPDDYEKKQDIINTMKWITNKMIYCAPEIISNRFNDMSSHLSVLLPIDKTDWSIEAWDIIRNMAVEVNTKLKENGY
jgi:hypothetical protein